MSLVRPNWEIFPRPSTQNSCYGGQVVPPSLDPGNRGMIIHYAIRSPTAAIRQLTGHTHTYTCHGRRNRGGGNCPPNILPTKKIQEFKNNDI